MTPGHEDVAAAAIRAATAETARARAAAALADAEEARDAIAAKLTDAVGRRRAIGLRRGEGRAEPTDVEELSVLSADISGLEALVERHNGQVSAAHGSAEAANGAAVAARIELQRAEGRATEQALIGRAEEAGRVLLETVRLLRATRDVLGGGVLGWRPCQELTSALTAANHGRCW